MPLQGPAVADALPEANRRRSFAARHGAGLAAGATALVLLAVAGAFLPHRSIEPTPPPPAHWFDDRAKLVSPGYAAGKSEYLQQYLPIVLHASVLIVTEPRAPGGAIEDYTAAAANAWRIGGQGADNGVVLFVFREPRTIRLEVGYGLEGSLPDIDAKHLVEATLIPGFAEARYRTGSTTSSPPCRTSSSPTRRRRSAASPSASSSTWSGCCGKRHGSPARPARCSATPISRAGSS